MMKLPKILREAPRKIVEMLKGDPAFMTDVFENYQLILSRSIAPERIMRVISANSDSGRTRVQKSKQARF